MFFTTVGAARYFVELRMKGKYRDLLALDRVRRSGLRHHAVHDRLREHPVQHVAHRRLDGVHGLPRPGHGHRQRDSAERRFVQGLRRARRCRQRDGDLHRRHRRRDHRGRPQRVRRARRGAQGQYSGVFHSHRSARTRSAGDSGRHVGGRRRAHRRQVFQRGRRGGRRPRRQRDRSRGDWPRRDEAVHARSSRGLRRSPSWRPHSGASRS